MSKMDDISQAVARATEYQARLERALAPSRSMADLARALQSPVLDINVDQIARRMLPPAHLTAVCQTISAIERDSRRFVEFARPPRMVDDAMKQMARMAEISEGIVGRYRVIQETLRSQASVFEKLSARVKAVDDLAVTIPQFSRAALAWNVATIGMANRMQDIGLLARREMLSTRLFAMPNAYSEFVRHTTDRLANHPAPDVAVRLRGSLYLAEHQLLDIADTINNIIVVPEDEDKPEDARVLAAPLDQQAELLACEAVEDETDMETLTLISPTARTVQLSRRVLNLVVQCNEAAKTSVLGAEIFKPTTRLMTVFSDLPWLSPTDRYRFGDAIDCLYCIFYEAAGSHRLRFLEEYGGPLTIEECDLIWCIKHLRNKWSRHDADHGEEQDIRKSWADLAAKFRWLGMAEHPRDAHHFRELHHQLLTLSEDFLLRILNGLKLRT